MHRLPPLHMLYAAHVFLLIDSTQPPQRIDVDAALWLAEHSVPYSLVFTKVGVHPPYPDPFPYHTHPICQRTLALVFECLTLVPWT